MSGTNQIHAIILTLDEERHIGRCIESIGGQCSSITVIDSGSKDRTVSIARALGAEVLHKDFVTHAGQVNYAVDALKSRGGWLLRIDADEILDSESQQTLREAIDEAPDCVGGLVVNRRIYFLGRRIRYGSIEPSWQLRLWRNGFGRCEQRWMDEHILVHGKVGSSKLVISDINNNSLSWWTAKHNSYASREAADLLNRKYKLTHEINQDIGRKSFQARTRRFFKEAIYTELPSGVRAVIYFGYRYFLRLGFLDGRAGWYFHLLQGFWYRTLVDAKIAEIEKVAATQGISIQEAIFDRTGLAFDAHTLPPGR